MIPNQAINVSIFKVDLFQECHRYKHAMCFRNSVIINFEICKVNKVKSAFGGFEFVVNQRFDPSHDITMPLLALNMHILPNQGSVT